MDKMRMIVAIDVVPSDDAQYPAEDQVVAIVQDILADVTKHDAELGFRVVAVTSR
jgi:hypothetical protein